VDHAHRWLPDWRPCAACRQCWASSSSSSEGSTAFSTGGRLNLTFSPTEAAGLGAFGTFLIALWRRTLDWRALVESLVETATTTAGLFAILIGAWIFSNFINYAGMPDALVAFVTGMDLSPLAVMALILVIYIALGCVFESLSMMVLTVPIFFPVVSGLRVLTRSGSVSWWWL
jgi:TRAP-type C4-dicarboxylate transport system permease large subunit